MMFLLLLLIPILCISLSCYVSVLIDYISYGSMSVVTLLVTVMLSLILSFIVLKLFVLSDKKNVKMLNLDNQINSIHGYFSFILLFVFGTSLLIRSTISNNNIYDFIVGVLLIVLFVYVTYEYMIKFKTDIFDIEDIEEYDDKIYLIYLSCNNLIMEYYVEGKNYKKKHKYECVYNPNLKYIKKIKQEVKDEK